MKKPVKLVAKPRQARATATRREQNVPGILYGRGLLSRPVEVGLQQVTQALQEAGTTSLMNLALESEDHPVIIRQVQYHPLRGTIQHVDFYQVRLDEAIRAAVPISFTGESTAVKDLGGVLVRNLDELEIEALPKDLPHDISADISQLTSFEKVIRVSDLQLPKGITVLEETDAVVALVQPPRSEEELEALSEEVKEDVEAVEGVVKEEPQEEGEAKPEGETPEATGKKSE